MQAALMQIVIRHKTMLSRGASVYRCRESSSGTFMISAFTHLCTARTSRFSQLIVSIAAAFLLQCFATTANAFDVPRGVTVGPSVGGITEYKLANGLTVLLFPDATQAKLTVNITYLVGSRHENYGETGQAHLLEHMLFKGSPKVPDVDAEYTKRGAQRNAITRTDITNYFGVFPASEDNLKFALRLEADRMVNAFLKKEDLDKEFSVVRNEYEAGENQPGQVLGKRLFAIAYDWHNYGNLPIGNRGDIEGVDVEKLRSFYKMYYQPDNAVLLIAGKFDPALALTTTAQEFGAIAKPSRALPQIKTIEPPQDGERSVVIRRKGDIQIIAAAYRVPGALHPDTRALSYAMTILGHTPSGRLHKKLVDTQKALGTAAQSLSYVDPHPMLLLAVQKAGENADALREELLREIESFALTPPTDEEMARTRQIVDNSYEAALAQADRVGLGLSSFIALGDWRLFFWGRDAHKEITADQVQKAAAKYFVRDNRSVATFLPENDPKRAEVPAAPEAKTLLAGWKPPAEVAQGEAFEASAKNVDARTQFTQIGEVKVAMLPKKTRGETVQVRINFKSGNEQSLTGRSDDLGLASALLTRGSAKFSRAAIADEVQKRKIRGGITGYETTRSELAGSIEFVAQVLREPTFPENELEQVRKESLAGLEFTKSDPGALAGERLSRHFNAYPKGHPFYASSREESEAYVRSFKRDDIVKAHADFSGASAGEIVIVGDFDPKEMTALLARTFGNWKSKAPYTRVASRLSQPAAINEWIDTPDKENAVIQMRTNFALKRDDADYAALWVANEIIGSGSIDSRLMKRVRGTDGLTYGINSTFDVGIYEAVASWGVNGIAAPQNVDRVEKAVLEEIVSARDKGFSAEEVSRVQAGVRASYDQSYASDTSVASMWIDRLSRSLKFADFEVFLAKVQAVTPEQARDAFSKYVEPSTITIVKAGDKKRARG
jgi:zinc protease